MVLPGREEARLQSQSGASFLSEPHSIQNPVRQMTAPTGKLGVSALQNQC